MSSGDDEQTQGAGRLLAGRYRVTGQLGRGGMGVVWRAVDEVLGREVAVKELRTYTDSAPTELSDLRLRMQREARAAARVRHPGVVAVHDIAEEAGRPLIVMELIDGPSLDTVLQERGLLAPGEAAALGAEVMDALAAAHRAGVLHRDVKPGNILLERSGRIVLTDFGIAAMDDPGDGLATQLTRSGELVGSLDYLAPERAQGQSPGPASDVWALGATLYAAVEGNAPFRRTSTWSTLTAIIIEPLPEPRHAGPLASLLRRLLDKDPQGRPDAEQSARLLRQIATAAPHVQGGAWQDGQARATSVLPDAPASGFGAARRERTVRSVPSVPPGFGPPAQRAQAGPGEPAGPAAEPDRPPGSPSAAVYAGSDTPDSGGHPVPGGYGGYGSAQPQTVPVSGGHGTPSGTSAPAQPRRPRGRAVSAFAAVAVVLAAAGITVAVLQGQHDTEATTSPSTPPPTSGSPTPDHSRGTVQKPDHPKRSPQDEAASPTPDGQPSENGDPGSTPATQPPPQATVTATPSRGGGSGGTSGGSSGGGSTPAPACHSIGGGKYNCTVWRTATSHTASGTKAGVLNAGTNYFYCQQNLGRRETYDQWTNVWWAKTDDDSGNADVYVSDVYIQGGANDEPVPGLPTC